MAKIPCIYSARPVTLYVHIEKSNNPSQKRAKEAAHECPMDISRTARPFLYSLS